MNSYHNETRSIPTPQTHPCSGAPTPSRRPTMLPWAFFIGNIRAAAVKNGRGSLNLVKQDPPTQTGCPKAHSNSFRRAPNAISTAAPAAAPSESDGHSGGIGWCSIVGSTEGMGRANTGSRENNGFHTNPMTRNQSHDPKPPLPT